ncbi:unnamed protein product [Soboliphyme baturini]|uniref:EF-hand domain-containing protein n=1 Tax=Soboliphyme baturini TaxID=241478 RepID=A0A183IHC1_9BILA|nr:unnamed protein product [Soboliphyme baturini]
MGPRPRRTAELTGWGGVGVRVQSKKNIKSTSGEEFIRFGFVTSWAILKSASSTVGSKSVSDWVWQSFIGRSTRDGDGKLAAEELH